MAGLLHIDGPTASPVDLLLRHALLRPGEPFAIAGPQGSGKSTLARHVCARASSLGLSAVAVSLDDFYLDLPERRRLARDVHPLLATRGPPGTHDLPLALATLDALVRGEPVRLPVFDKLADRRLRESHWPRADRCDLVVFEGWCLKVPAQAPQALVAPVNALERIEDPAAVWRTWCNAALRDHYPALWSRLPRLLVLEPPGFDVVSGWRWEQECALRAARPEATGMDRDGVERFVRLFERVTRHGLAQWPRIADLRLRLDAGRVPRADDVAALRAGLPARPTIDR